MNELRQNGRTVFVGGDVVAAPSKEQTTVLTHQQQQQQQLPPSSQRVARLIQRRIGFAGAKGFVKRHGAKEVMATVKSVVLEYRRDDQPQRDGRWVHWQVRYGVLNPAGLLTYSLKNGDVR